ncbi:MAG: response regulator transcription factor [Bacteroidetes bacterium]|nr:response regulator transcription factor [Bacteroidota bacterium]
MPRILLVEDEPGLVLTLTDRLTAEGYDVTPATDGEQGFRAGLEQVFDLMILDVMLPKKNGFDLVRDFRQKGIETPVLMLTARGQVVDKVVGLKLGADDYLTKPFDMMELTARLEVLLRRRNSQPQDGDGVFQFGSLYFNFKKGQIRKSGKPVELTAQEFRLLQYLVTHPGLVISRDELLKEVWGLDASLTTRTVDVHMSWLRQKLEENPKFPARILTVHGLGYRWEG